ncbi:MAG TPA: CPBP family glutamic-type intramembrane protease [Solirubrobacterales bacterium]
MTPDDFTAPAPATARPVEYASFGRRLGAALLDSLVLIIGFVWLLGGALLTIALLIISLSFYFQFCEKRWGQTIGKNATGIRVLSLDGSELTWNQTAWRNLLRLVDLPLAMIGADYLIVRGSPRQQRLGDRAAKTIVVRERAPEAREPAQQPAHIASVPPPEPPYGAPAAPTTAELFGEATEALGRHPAAGSARRNGPEAANESSPPPTSAVKGPESAAPTEARPTASALGWTAPGFPYAIWEVRRAVFGVFIGLLVGGLFAPLLVVPFDPHFHSTGGKLVAQALLEVTLVFVAIGVAIGAASDISLREGLASLGLRRFRPSAFGWMALGLFSYYVAAIAYGALITEPDQKDIARDLGLDAGVLAAIPVVALIVVVAPIAEEIFFRGMLFGGLRKRLSTFPAAAISALVFGALHGTTGITAVPPLIVFGFMLALLYERTGSLVPGMIAHAFNNALALALSS